MRSVQSPHEYSSSCNFPHYGTVHNTTVTLWPHTAALICFTYATCRSQWPRGLRHGIASGHLLGLWVRIPSGARMSVSRDRQVEISASGWSLVQRSLTECDMSNKCDREASSGEAMTRHRVEAPGWEMPLTFFKTDRNITGFLMFCWPCILVLLWVNDKLDAQLRCIKRLLL